MNTDNFFLSVVTEAKRTVGDDAAWDRLTMQERSQVIYATMRRTDAQAAGGDNPDDSGANESGAAPSGPDPELGSHPPP